MKTLLGGVLGKVPRPTPAMVVALLALLVAASGAAFAAGSFTASDGTITACRDNRTGTLRVIDAASQTCGSKEMKIWWKDGITGTVADSDKLDNKDSSAFLGKNERAADSAMLGGQAPSAYGGVVTGRINGVTEGDVPVQYAAATGISKATADQSSVQTLSPGRDVVLRDFTVKLTESSGDELQARQFSLLVNNGELSYGLCEIVGHDTTCTSPPAAAVIPAGSVISLQVRSLNSGSPPDALFGYRLTTT